MSIHRCRTLFAGGRLSRYSRPLLLVLVASALAVTASGKPKGGIGSPSPEGTAVQKGDLWTVTGGGADIWGPSDQFQFVSYSASGNCTLTVKMMSVGEAGAHEWAKAGLMIRADESVGSPHAMVAMSHTGSIQFITRNVAGGDSRSDIIPGMSLPIHFRLVRTGNDFTASYSQDGKAWTTIGKPMTVPMKQSALAGMAVTSHADGVPCTAVFSNFVMKR